MNRKFMSVKRCIIDKINHMSPGIKLPSERDLIEEFGFSRPTIQKALMDLEQEGYLYRVPRQGTFVSDRRLRKSMNMLKSFAEDLQASGDSASTRLISFEIIAATPEIAEKLALQAGDAVYSIVRLRYKNAEPIIYDDSYFAPFALKEIPGEMLVESLYRYIEQRGFKVAMAQEIVSAVIPPADIQQALELGVGEPVVRVDMVAYLSDGRAFEYTISHKNPSKYVLEIKAYRS